MLSTHLIILCIINISKKKFISILINFSNYIYYVIRSLKKLGVYMQNIITDKEFELISSYIKQNYGMNLSGSKKSLVYSRLSKVLAQKGFTDFTQYYNYLVSDTTGKASVDFIDKMTTNHTFFMRETDHFDYLSKVVLPYIESTYKDGDLRLWCAGCSSGEESYTLQMIVSDYFNSKTKWNTDILATDISNTVLKKAIDGVYSKKKVQSLPQSWINNYFKEYDENNLQVSDFIKNKVIYRKFNLMEKIFPFKRKFQVIFCRNVMIYFDDTTREELVKKFYNASEKGAYLFIGHSETLNNIDCGYEYVMPAIYRKV